MDDRWRHWSGSFDRHGCQWFRQRHSRLTYGNEQLWPERLGRGLRHRRNDQWSGVRVKIFAFPLTSRILRILMQYITIINSLDSKLQIISLVSFRILNILEVIAKSSLKKIAKYLTLAWRDNCHGNWPNSAFAQPMQNGTSPFMLVVAINSITPAWNNSNYLFGKKLIFWQKIYPVTKEIFLGYFWPLITISLVFKFFG